MTVALYLVIFVGSLSRLLRRYRVVKGIILTLYNIIKIIKIKQLIRRLNSILFSLFLTLSFICLFSIKQLANRIVIMVNLGNRMKSSVFLIMLLGCFLFCWLWRRRYFIKVHLFYFCNGFDFYVVFNFLFGFFTLDPFIAVLTGVILIVNFPDRLLTFFFFHIILHFHEGLEKSLLESLNSTFFYGLSFYVVELLEFL